MKRIYLLITALFLLLGGLWAQNGTVHHFGYMGAQSPVTLEDGTVVQFTVSGGTIVSPGQFTTVVQDQMQVLGGFPGMVSYFPRVFDTDLFISKGYFSDYVQLQWNIVGQQDRISSIKVFRKALGSTADSVLVATVAADNFTYRDEYAEKGVLYKYTVFAAGIADELRLPLINVMEGVGFAFPFGTASGRITYEGGTAVEGVQVLAETDGNLGGKSLYLNGSDAYLSLPHRLNNGELELSTGFSIQLWNLFEGATKGTLLSKGSQYELAYEPGTLTFSVGDVTLDMPYTHPDDAYFHVTATFDPAVGLNLYVQENDNHLETASAGIPSTLAASQEVFYFGRSTANDNYYEGYIDEVRLWNVVLTEEEAQANFSRYLSGNETGLSGYWKLNSGIGNGFYDFSRIGFDFNENHGELLRTAWSDIIPEKSQLAYRGVTDANGNYVVTGFPFETAGSQYTFTPLFGVHEFEPTQHLRYVGDGSSIFNGLDYDDVSSFEVSGTVQYRNSFFPVEGISILIDGNAAINEEGQLITTNNLGEFTVDVPIGLHSLRMSKSGHVFEAEGRFPPTATEGVIAKYDFQQPLAGLEFIDSTVVKLVGKVVGGPTEADKPRGFGLSNNNIGIAQINITSEKGYDITQSDSTEMYDERDIVSYTNFSTKFVTIYPDELTGEFVTFLPPEKYLVTGVSAGSYSFGTEHNVSLNLEQFFEQTESYDELVMALLDDGNEVPNYDPIDSTQYDYFTSEISNDTTYIYGGKNFIFEKEKDFILRVKPDIEVVNKDDLEVFGERLYRYEDELTSADIDLIDGSNNYTFGYPVFFQQSRYEMFISVFEEYVNSSTAAVDRVPVKDGTIEIVNEFAIQSDLQELELNDKGEAKYIFGGGVPNFTTNGAESFTKPFSLTAITGEAGNIRTIWNEATPLRGLVFGGRPTGNSFVTTGPNQIITVLRDPPGSNSFAFLEQGNSITSTISWGSSITETNNVNAKISLGPDIEISTGIFVSKTTEIDVTADLELGLEMTSEHTSSGESINTVTSTKTWSTSANANFVSSPGDVFVGNSTNIVYGAAVSVQPIPVGASECVPANSCGTTEFDGFTLGQRSKLSLNPEFGTMFIYTQSHIENVLIPELINLRNSFLIYSANPKSVVATGDIIYASFVTAEDDRYGSANYSIANWGDDATTDVGVGPSYQMAIPAGFDLDQVSDTVAFFNKQIEGWVRTLEDNERVKVQAQLSENISFDGGTNFASSETVESSSSISYDFNVSINTTMAAALGITVDGVGAEVNLSRSVNMGSSQGGGSTVANNTTYGYTLADEENAGTTADFYSIDVKNPSDGFGPVFVSRAGVTSCPYEGEEKTQYFEPGQHTLSFATIQVEKPVLTIVNPLAANIPSNREAEIVIELSNESESGSDVFYNLSVDDQSNPNGAILSIDGAVLTGDGRGFYVPAGQVVSKILKVSKGSDDINDYEDIGIKLSSQCDNKISDSQTFSVFFQPGCSDIRLVAPVDQWVVNTNTVPEETMNIVFDDYDLQNGQFRYAAFQYKSASSSQWISNMLFYNPQLVNQAEFDALDEPKAWLDESGATLYAWDMSALSDRTYDLRVASICEISPGNLAETPSDIHSGIKDTVRPVSFGSPQPADGVLSANDEIMIQFNETIEQGLLTPFNFSLTGVLNTAEIGHSASVNFDGINDYVKIADGLNLSDRSFTVEFWIKREDFAKEQVVYSKGYGTENVLEMGFTVDNKFFVNTGGDVITSASTYTDISWNHYALVYSAVDNEVSVFMNDQYVMDGASITDFTGEGSIAIGKSAVTNDRFFEGNIHELRVWTKSRQIGDVYALQSKMLTGSEVGLAGYWPMDEAYGVLAFDLARSRHANLFADWEVSPAGKSYAFNGVDEHLEINTGSTVIVTPEMDFTIEFWFKGTPGQTNAVMFSSGKGDGSDVFNDPANSLSIGFNGAGVLEFVNNGEVLEVGGDYLDNNWHHFALSLLRQSNTNIFIDGTQKATTASAGFGGLSGATMWIGARGYKDNAVDVVIDKHFDGSIDDFRVWNLGKKSNQIGLNRTSRLVGDELGLIGYYPFEFYQTVTGVKIMTPSITDQWQNLYGANAGTATSFGGADFSDDTPNIKDARPVDKVDFDWVVNDDKIIITPSSTFTPLIEQTILEITIQNVEDLNENRLASPITWTAFVDKNQLKWGTDKIVATKEVYEAYTFSVDVVNYGGTETNYSIDNLPQWLSASPSSGVLDPLSSETIVFTVNEGLNTGYYLEDVFLSSDFGYDEKLTVDLQVFSPAPEWVTNPHDFQYSMNLVAQLEIGDILSSDINDRVAAFVNDTIRGDVNLIYLADLDLYEVFLDIYSNVEAGETVELRVWDASKGVEYRNALPNITFASNSIIGTPSVPDVIMAGSVVVQNVQLAKGWSWSSFNVSSSSLTDINSLMDGVIAETGDQIKGIDKFDIYTEGFGWSGTLSSNGGLQNGPMYLFKVSNPAELNVIGTKADPVTSTNISTGWNWLGFIPRFNMSLNEAFAFYNPSNGDIIKSQFAFAVYDTNLGWIGSLKNLEPGKGYLFNSASTGSFVYPESSSLSGRTEENIITEFQKLDRHLYPNTMTVVAEVVNDLGTDFVLGAYDGSEIRGLMEPITLNNGDVRYFLTLHGDADGSELSLKLIHTATMEEVLLDQKITFSVNETIGTLADPFQLTGFGAITGLGDLNGITFYPNPFFERLHISIPASEEVPTVILTDLSGKKISTLDVNQVSGGWSAAVDGKALHLKQGIYLINIHVDGEMKSYRIIKAN